MLKYVQFSIMMFKIIGLCPWSGSITPKNAEWLLSESPSGSFYNILLILSNTLLYIYMLFFSSAKVDYIEFVDSANITKYVHIFLLSFGNITLIIIWLNHLLRQGILIRCLNLLINVDGNSGWEENEAYNHFKPIFMGYFTLFIIEMIYQFLTFEFATPVLYWMVPFVVNTWLLAQYTLIINGLLQRFKSINRAISAKFNCGDQDDNLFAVKFKVNDSVTDVINIKLTHKKLYEISQGVADFFAIPLLVAILYFSASVINTLYFVLLIFIKEDYFPASFHLGTGFWITMISGYFIGLTTVVTKTVREFGKTADGVHLVLDRCIVNPKVKKELIGFSRDLLHRHLEFSTYGIVSLDGSLIYTMFGTIVTYLIILIQFRLR